MKFPLVDISDVDNTKDRILLTAVTMFAEKGYAAVSVRDIAKAVNIKASSLYNHFENKEALFDAIVDTIQDTYLDFFKRVDLKIAEVSGFAEVLDCLFAELKEVYHMFIYYGVSLIACEQFRNERARSAFHDIYLKIGIDYSTRIFDYAIERGWVEPFDTRMLATFFMNNVFAGSLVRTQEAFHHETAYGAKDMFVSLQRFMLNAVEVTPS